jgi:hypothetical protein
MSKWSHLPNAVHIDRILAHLKAHPEKWTYTRAAAWDAAWRAAHDAAWDAAWGAIRTAAWDAAWGAIRTAAWEATLFTAGDEAWDEVWNAAAGGALALISNDTCAYLLSEKIEHVELLASLGQPEAILLLPAVRAMSHE